MVSACRFGTPLARILKREEIMKQVLSQLQDWIKLVTQVGIGLIALGVIVEIVFGKDKLFGGGVVSNLSEIVGSIGGENGFVGLVAILLIMGIFHRMK